MKQASRSWILLIVAAAIVAFAPAVAAQARRGATTDQLPSAGLREVRGRVTGRITDSRGAPLPGITLTISGAALAEPRMAVTDAEGRFEAAGLPAGEVTVTCSAPGFLQWRRDGVTISPGAEVTVDVVMRRLSEVTAAPISRGRGPQGPQPTRPGAQPVPGDTAPVAARPPLPGVESPTPTEPALPPPPPPRPHQMLDEIERFVQRLDTGSVAFNAPERLRTGETVEMRLRLAPLLSVDALKDQLRNLPGTLEGATVKIAPRMEAVLTGQDFAITAIGMALGCQPDGRRYSQAPSRAERLHRRHFAHHPDLRSRDRRQRRVDAAGGGVRWRQLAVAVGDAARAARRMAAAAPRRQPWTTVIERRRRVVTTTLVASTTLR
jgi:hypothetical protein